MEVRPGYKQTETGVIPEDWHHYTLEEACERISVGLATSVTQHYRNSGVPIVRNLNIKDGYFDGRDMLYITEQFAEISNSKAAKALDVLTVRTGANLGDTCVLPEEFDNCQTFTTLITTPRKALLSSYFLCLHMGSPKGKKELARLQVGGGKGNLNSGNLKNYRVDVPPLPEQRAIAAALSDVDELLDGLTRLIAKKRDLKQAAMQQLLTGQNRLPGFSGEWEMVSLDMLASRATGVWGKNEPNERNSRLVEIIRAGDISQDGKLTATATRYVAPEEYEKAKCALDDLVITTSGNGLGKLWWCDGRGNIAASNFVRVLHPKAEMAVGRFLFYALRTGEGLRKLQENTATSAYPNLRPTYFSTAWIPLPLPPEQTAIATVLSDMDAELAVLEARRDKTCALKQAMMQELLTGKIRLV